VHGDKSQGSRIEAVRSVHSKRYQSLLQRLRKARLDAGLTQVQAAELLGRAQSFVSKCESGERRVDVVELEEFAKIYGRSLSFFLPKEEKS
jgi:transcriptional regulator with XRE-family HTH domain